MKKYFARELYDLNGKVDKYNLVELCDDGTTTNILTFYKTVNGCRKWCSRNKAEFIGVRDGVRLNVEVL